MSTDTTPAAPAKEKHNKLDLRSQFKLLDWVRNHEDLARTESDPKLAAMASAELDLKITPSNVMSTREALNIEKTKPTAPATVEERLKRLEMTVGTLITWSQQHLGESGAIALLKLLSDPSPSVSPSPLPPLPASSESLPGLETTVNGESPQQP